MPWPIFNRPSIQLGALKAYLETKGGIPVDTFHPYLETAHLLGAANYSKIAHSGWGGEALFSPLLFAEKYQDAKRLFRQTTSGTLKNQYDALITLIEKQFTRWLPQLQLNQYELIGFTVCFNQLIPSLYLAQEIKKQYPDLPIVFGGSSCSGPLGTSLLNHFDTIDFVIDGEGEQALLGLHQFLCGTEDRLPQKVHSKQHLPLADKPTPALDLSTLPPPDYRPYFNQMRSIFATEPFIPVLPVEFSRGCWWNKCTFCNLNLQWHDYRFKKAEQMLKEVNHLRTNYESLTFSFTDNALPPKEADLFFSALARTELHYDFFAEIRGITNLHRLELYRKGGLKAVQVGIEAFSNSLLEKMDKGTTVLDNLAMMKLCAQTGIALEGNIITEFPTTTEQEITETLQLLEVVLPFAPLAGATFFLGTGSPISENKHHFGIQATLPHPKNRLLYPHPLLSSMQMLINSYRGDKELQRRLWKPVQDKMTLWQTFHRKRTGKAHPLHFRDGGTFIIIRQEKVDGLPLLHKLRGLSRKIYLSCETPTKFFTLLENFPSIKPEQLQQFIDDMCDKKLMFQERKEVLALAVPLE